MREARFFGDGVGEVLGDLFAAEADFFVLFGVDTAGMLSLPRTDQRARCL